MYLGDYPASHTAVCIPFDSFAAATGAPSATSNFAAGDILIYKDGGTTQRSSSSGITVSTSFDSQTGLQMIVIDLSDNTDAGFYAAGHEYQVGVADITIDGQTVRFWAATFSIERAGGVLALIKANTIKVDVNTIKTQAVTCAAGVTVLASVGTAATSTAQTGDNYVRLGAPAGASVSADIASVKSDTGTTIPATLATITGYTATEIATLIARLGAWTGTGVNTVLGAFKALLSKTASAPSDIGGTFDPATDSTEALRDNIGTSAGASLSADIAAVQTDATAIKAKTDKLRGVTPTYGAIVDDSDNTAAIFLTDLAETEDDHWKDAFLTFLTGDLTGQTRRVSSYDGSTKFVTAAAFSKAPEDGDTFVIVND